MGNPSKSARNDPAAYTWIDCPVRFCRSLASLNFASSFSVVFVVDDDYDDAAADAAAGSIAR